MARYERDAQRIIVQIVYDGPALAGKTTNLSELCKCFSTQRRSELFSAETARGRTLFLDWLEVQGGLVAGQQLVCRLLAVPGQAVLARRRWFLLQRADALVFILNGTPDGVNEALPMFERAKSFVDQHRLPLIVQANKQDLPGAVAPEEIALRLGVEPAQVVPARSDSGQGVKETALLVIRAVADQLKQRIVAEGLESLSTEAPAGDALVRAMQALERSEPMSPTEIVQRGAELAAAASVRRNAPVEPSLRPKRASSAARKPKGKVKAKRKTSGVRSRGTALEEPPPLPAADTPTGFLWPTSTGGELLRRIPFSEAVWRKDLAETSGEGDGRAFFVFEAGLWCLKTGSLDCHADLDSAHRALLISAHRKLSLGELLAKNTLLALSSDERGRYWLWTISPWLTSVEMLITHAQARNDERALRDVLVAYADAVLRAIELARTQSLKLCLSPRCFAMLGEQVFYVGDDIAEGGLSPDFGSDVLERVEQLPAHIEAVEAYVTHIEYELRGRFNRPDLETLGVTRLLQGMRPRTALGREALGRWLRAANGD